MKLTHLPFVCVSFLLIFSVILPILYFIHDNNMLKNQYTENFGNLPSEFETSVWGWTNTTEEISISAIYGDSQYPVMVIDGSENLHIVWHDQTNYSGAGTDFDIFYRRWNATIRNWTQIEVISTESNANSRYPSLTVEEGGSLHVAWVDSTNYSGAGTDGDIFYRCWNTTTNTWTLTEVVSTESTADSLHPSIAVDGDGDVHVAWYDYTDYNGAGSDSDIFYKRWNATTGAWTLTEVVSTESTEWSQYPVLAVDMGGHLHVLWEDYTDYGGAGEGWDIFYKRWNASLDIWTMTEVFSIECVGIGNYSGDPAIMADESGHVHIVWHAWNDIFYNYSDFLYKCWNATTGTWAPTESISDFGSDPAIAVDYSGSVHVAWSSGSDWSISDIFYKYRNATTGMWSMIAVVSTEGPRLSAENPTIVVDGDGRVHVAWQEGYKLFLDNIFYKKAAIVPDAPTLMPILPNPDEDGIIELNWSERVDATIYYVYRDTSPITWIPPSGMTPIAAISTNYYEDTLTINDIYYYVIVAGNASGAGPISNCESVMVAIPPAIPFPPVLEPILPNPDYDGLLELNWSSMLTATVYHVYRNTSPITSVDGMIPIASISTTKYQETIRIRGTYYYVVVAGNPLGNSSISNCENVQVIPQYIWTPTEVVSTESTDISLMQSIAVGVAGDVHVAWEDWTNYNGAGTDRDIFYKFWNATTGTWTLTEVVSPEITESSQYPAIGVDEGGDIHVVWDDSTNYSGAGTDLDIFYKRWNATTGTWTLTEVVSTESTGGSGIPAIAVGDDGHLHVAWIDITDYDGAGTDHDIFYKRWNATTGTWTLT
ncbi:MAG: hypothetical protein HWN66_20390, partial [Candidatus Helarchaeota archaeon]|nr:hypothetical protein [Candidatus Helarchaeota archaeon]